MESPASIHPADETLVSYGLGKLDDTLAEAVNKHLEQCVPCRRRVAELSSDSFVGVVGSYLSGGLVGAGRETVSGGDVREAVPSIDSALTWTL